MLVKIGRCRIETDSAKPLATWLSQKDKKIARLYDRGDGRYFVIRDGNGETHGEIVTREKAATYFYKRNRHLIENNNSRHFNYLFLAAFGCDLYDLLPEMKKKGKKSVKKNQEKGIPHVRGTKAGTTRFSGG